MQPQNVPTDYNRQAIPGQGMPPVPPTLGVTGAMPQPPAMPAAQPQEQAAPQPDSSNIEQWTTAELQKVIAETTQNPHDRANRIAELKSRYQQTVLGIRPRSGE